MMSIVGTLIVLAVADDVVVAGVAQHGHALLDRAALADEVDDRLGALAVGQSRARCRRACRRRPRCGRRRARSASARPSRVAVDDDDLGGGHRLRHWIPMCPRPPAPMTTARVPGYRSGDRLLDRVVGGKPGVGERGDVLRAASAGRALRPSARSGRAGIGEPAVADRCRGRRVLAVHVVAGAARAAQPAGDQGVQDDRVADRDVGDRGADLLDPAGVLVTERVGQLDAGLLGPLTLDGCAGRCGTARRRRCCTMTSCGPVTSGSGTPRRSSGSWYACSRAAFMRPPPRWPIAGS